MTWKKHKEKIPKWLHYPLYAIAIAGYIIDVLFNWIYGSVMFLELPRELTLSERLRRLLLSGKPWQVKLSYFLCHYLIEPWDSGHCGLGYTDFK